MEKVITNDSGVSLEITEQVVKHTSLEELLREKQVTKGTIANLEEKLAIIESRINVLGPEVDKFKEKHSDPVPDPVIEMTENL